MSGPTMAMAPAVEAAATAPFHRSHSSPDLLSTLALAKPPRSIAALAHQRALSCKSLPSLPAFDVPSFDPDSDFHSALFLGAPQKKPAGTDVTLATHSPAAAVSAKKDKTVAVPTVPTARPPSELPPTEKLARRKSLIDRPRSWIPSSRSTPNVRELAVQGPRPPRQGSEAVPRDSRTVSESFADFARRSWISGSRSPSPKGRSPIVAHGDGEKRQRSASGGSPTPPSGPARKRVISSADGNVNYSTESLSGTSRALNRASVYLTKIKQRPQSVFVKGASSLSQSTSSPPIARDAQKQLRNPSQTAMSSDISVDSGNTSTTQPASETGSQRTSDTGPMPRQPTPRDPLKAAFKELDVSFAKFAAKNTTAQRMVIVKSALVPFLRRQALDGSNADTKALSPEDVERRAVILNKWWNGLLEMLDGPAGRSGMGGTGPTAGVLSLQPVAGVDRPALLEATAAMMMRPEWRLNTTAFRPLADRSPGERVRARSNTADSRFFGGVEAGSLVREESAEQSVRAMFVNNLLAQMALVVDKMSLRHAPLSLVNFSGKACAYAFFFVPGAAEVLVRLWGLDKNIDLIRRVADAIGLPRRSKGESDDIVALFPPNMGPLGWSSVSAMGLKLRRAAKLGAQLGGIAWRGPWLSRWRGGDTDLFFIFCKYFFILADGFMPSELPLVEKARAPAFVLLLAQLLQTLDSTIHRQAAVDDAMMGGPPLPDALLGADAALTSLPPLLPSNLLRGMDENRMIVLLKDLLSSGEPLAGARHTFAEAFVMLLAAATRKTSQYDHNACYMLCDFLEQSLLAFDSYYGYATNAEPVLEADQEADHEAPLSRPSRADYVDWPFWLDVFKMVLASNNTLSEVRMLSFIFSAWDIITADATRKEDLCLNWLLTDEVFEKFFNNWCPMVRAYYMRLLCWRMCRDGGSTNHLDASIFLTVSQRLKTVWSHYLWLKQKADMEGTLPPSTAPCLPQPGRRFMIVRTEVGVPQPGLFVTFDSLSSTLGTLDQSGMDYRGQLSGDGSSDEQGAESNASAKKKWSLLGKVLSFTSSTTMGVSGVGPSSPTSGAAKPTYDEQFDQARRDTAASRVSNTPLRLQTPTGGGGAPQPPPKPSTSQAVAPSSDSDSTGSSPVFDAAQFVFRFMLHNIPWQMGPNGLAPPLFRERVLTRPRLPAPAQARVSAKTAASGGRCDSPPPPAPGLPPATRRFSGLMMTGLVSEARNANPAQSVPRDDSSSAARMSVGSTTSSYESGASMTSGGVLGRQSPGQSSDSDSREGSDIEGEHERGRQAVRPVEPKGVSVLSAKYAGRALAEWSMVINECNSFVDRRRDEGVLGLRDVEVPTLGVDGLRRLA